MEEEHDEGGHLEVEEEVLLPVWWILARVSTWAALLPTPCCRSTSRMYLQGMHALMLSVN